MGKELCSYCGKSEVRSKGLCRSCYYRQKNTGTLEYKYKGKSKPLCKNDSCKRDAKTKGFCQKHYELFLKYGEDVSPFGYGERKNHNLYNKWRTAKRCRLGVVERWEDFWLYVEDVGEKQEGKVLKRKDIQKPWGPNNFFWHQKTSSAESCKDYAKKWRKANPLRSKSHSLKRDYGIDIDKYMDIYEKQNGKCKICEYFFKSYSEGEKGKVETLVVDHCHKTGNIRGLLCHMCNKALGGFQDSVAILENALKYLKQNRGF